MKRRQKRSKHEYIHSSLTPIISLEGFLRLIIKYTEIEHNIIIFKIIHQIKIYTYITFYIIYIIYNNYIRYIFYY